MSTNAIITVAAAGSKNQLSNTAEINNFNNYATDAQNAIDNHFHRQNWLWQNGGGRAASNRAKTKITHIRTQVQQGQLSVEKGREQIDQLLKNWKIPLPLTSQNNLYPQRTEVTGAGANGRSLPPFPLNQSSDLPQIKRPADYLPRMQYALARAAEWAGPELVNQLRALASPQGAAMLMAVAALQLTPAGPAVSTALVTLGGVNFSHAVLTMIDKVMNGTSVAELNDAGRAFAVGMSVGAINAVLGGLMHLTGVKVAALREAYKDASAYNAVRNGFANPKNWQDVGRLLLFLDDGGKAYSQLPADMKVAVREGLVASKTLAKPGAQHNSLVKALNTIDKLDTGLSGSRIYTNPTEPNKVKLLSQGSRRLTGAGANGNPRLPSSTGSTTGTPRQPTIPPHNQNNPRQRASQTSGGSNVNSQPPNLINNQIQQYASLNPIEVDGNRTYWRSDWQTAVNDAKTYNKTSSVAQQIAVPVQIIRKTPSGLTGVSNEIWIGWPDQLESFYKSNVAKLAGNPTFNSLLEHAGLGNSQAFSSRVKDLLSLRAHSDEIRHPTTLFGSSVFIKPTEREAIESVIKFNRTTRSDELQIYVPLKRKVSGPGLSPDAYGVVHVLYQGPAKHLLAFFRTMSEQHRIPQGVNFDGLLEKSGIKGTYTQRMETNKISVQASESSPSGTGKIPVSSTGGEPNDPSSRPDDPKSRPPNSNENGNPNNNGNSNIPPGNPPKNIGGDPPDDPNEWPKQIANLNWEEGLGNPEENFREWIEVVLSKIDEEKNSDFSKITEIVSAIHKKHEADLKSESPTLAVKKTAAAAVANFISSFPPDVVSNNPSLKARIHKAILESWKETGLWEALDAYMQRFNTYENAGLGARELNEIQFGGPLANMTDAKVEEALKAINSWRARLLRIPGDGVEQLVARHFPQVLSLDDQNIDGSTISGTFNILSLKNGSAQGLQFYGGAGLFDGREAELQQANFNVGKGHPIAIAWTMSDFGYDTFSPRFENFNVTGANLEGAKITGITIDYFQGSGATMTNVDVSGVHIKNADFSNQPLSWRLVARNAYILRGNLSNSNFYEADFTGSYLVGADCTGSCFEGAEFPWADLTGIQARGSNFSRANLREALLDGANLSNSNFAHAHLSGGVAEINGAPIGGIDFTDTDLSFAWMQGMNFYGATFVRATFWGAHLEKTTFRQGNSSGADFSGANLSGAKFINVNLTSADFSGVDLSNGSFEGTTNLTGVIFNKDTMLDGVTVGPSVQYRIPEDVDQWRRAGWQFDSNLRRFTKVEDKGNR